MLFDLAQCPVPTKSGRYRRTAHRVNVVTGCWEWAGKVRADGYATITTGGRLEYAHRAYYEAMVGPVPQGRDLDHLCRVRHCVNPAHLEPVEKRLNSARGNAGLHWRKLTQADVDAIRAAAALGETQKSIAKRHDVSPSAISRIVTGVYWWHRRVI